MSTFTPTDGFRRDDELLEGLDGAMPPGGLTPQEASRGPAAGPPSTQELAGLPKKPALPHGRRLVAPEAAEAERHFKPAERLVVLDVWQRSGLPAGDFAPLVGVSKYTLYQWKKRFEAEGPVGLEDRQRTGAQTKRLSDVTRRAILMLKRTNPDWGCQMISNMLARGPALPACPATVAKVLHEEGFELEEHHVPAHDEEPKRFERARPNQLWQTDLFSFNLKKQNRRVYLVAFMDDHSRYLVGHGLHGTQSGALVLEILRSAMASYGQPEEILTDNGSQYVTWRGRSNFTKELEQRGIKQVVSKPKHPQTLGKIERFWGTLWRDLIEKAIFEDLEDARRRIAHFVDHYNFQRPHQGIDNLTPADRYFGAAQEVKAAIQQRVQENALELARRGVPKKPFYLAGQDGEGPFSLHREGQRMIMMRPGQERTEVELAAPHQPSVDDLPEAACEWPPEAFATDEPEQETQVEDSQGGVA